MLFIVDILGYNYVLQVDSKTWTKSAVVMQGLVRGKVYNRKILPHAKYGSTK